MAVSVNACGICDGALNDALTAPAARLGASPADQGRVPGALHPGAPSDDGVAADAAAIWGGGDSQDVQVYPSFFTHSVTKSLYYYLDVAPSAFIMRAELEHITGALQPRGKRSALAHLGATDTFGCPQKREHWLLL